MSKMDTKSDKNYSGIWRSDYTYHSSDRNEDRVSIEYVKLYPRKNGFVFETIPKANESYELARFTLDDNIATGTWQEVTSPVGDYKGVAYHGAAQLLVSKDGKHMKGKWVGFGKNMDIKTGPWEFTYLGEDVSVLDELDRAVGQ